MRSLIDISGSVRGGTAPILFLRQLEDAYATWMPALRLDLISCCQQFPVDLQEFRHSSRIGSTLLGGTDKVLDQAGKLRLFANTWPLSRQRNDTRPLLVGPVYRKPEMVG